MDKKLSVVQRTVDKQGWDKSNQFTATDIQDIKTFAVKSDRSLNAIPSPLARIHLFESAFQMVAKDEAKNVSDSGEAYQKIVSDCFDVFELIYNWNYHLRDNAPLSIIKWEQESEIKTLTGGSKGHKLLAKTLEIFLNETAFKRDPKILIFCFKGVAFAGTSPFTGFFTTANPLNNFELFNPNTRRNYFSKSIPFAERKPVIQNYISEFFSSQQLKNAESTSIIRNYLFSYADRMTQTTLDLVPLQNSFNEIFGSKLMSNNGKTDEDYFEKSLIKLTYPINDECFYTAKLETVEGENHYLLPLSELFFKDFKPQDISSSVMIKEIDGDTVEVIIHKTGKQFKKHYRRSPRANEQGKIVDLNETYQIKLGLGIFPFIKIESEGVPVQYYNDYYKVMLVADDANLQFLNTDFKLAFSIGGHLIESPQKSNIEITADHRTLMDQASQSLGSTYYTLKGKDGLSVCFDYVQLTLPALDDQVMRAVIVPKWQAKPLGTKKIDYAVDFGTTNTFAAYSDRSGDGTPTALEFDMGAKPGEKHFLVALLSKPHPKTPGNKWIQTFELGPGGNFKEVINIQNEEFIPTLLNKEKYPVPYRTVVYQKDGIPDNKKTLFGSTNISFVYQQPNAATQHGQRYIPNLKWNVNQDDSYKESIRIYLEELFLLLRMKTLMLNGNPKLSKICWFSPLSFSPDAERAYRILWDEQFKKVFNSDSKQLTNITESEAPYYFYFKEAEKMEDLTAVLTIDIGGGTTDMMYIKDDKVLCTSVNFGANVLWGNGFTDFSQTAKENGIYRSIREKIDNRLKSTLLKGLNEDYNRLQSPYSSDEIINFWIINNDETKVLEALDDGAFKLTYLLHFTGIIYHIYSILKAKGEIQPTSIIFSGNGSKYLDLIQDARYLEKVCAYFGKHIFGTQAKTPKILLPKENRKEATCYGGLFEPENKQAKFDKVNHLGTEPGEKEYPKYKDIDLHKTEVFKSVTKNFDHFLDVFFEMNEATDLGFRQTFGIKTDLPSIKNYLKAKISENLDTGYRKRRQIAGKEDDVTDSLFFNPLIGLLFRINKLEKNDLAEFTPRTQYFAAGANGDLGFLIRALTSDSNHDTLYVITVNDAEPEEGEVTLFQSERSLKKALKSVDGYLQPVCDWGETPPVSADHQIIMTAPGKLQKEGDYWVVKEKIKVEFN